jgi:hypothetical protein
MILHINTERNLTEIGVQCSTEDLDDHMQASLITKQNIIMGLKSESEEINRELKVQISKNEILADKYTKQTIALGDLTFKLS